MQSEGDANWAEIARAVKIRDEVDQRIPIHGNGDVFSYSTGLSRVEETGVDGVMIGRGIFQNPWFFNPDKGEISQVERIDMLIRHTRLFEKTWGGVKNFNILKRFYKIYINGFSGAVKMRADLMEAKSFADVYSYFNKYPIEMPR